MDAIQKLEAPAKKLILTKLAAALQSLAAANTPQPIHAYMKMPLALFPDHIIKQYNLGEKAKNGFVYLEMRKAIYGLPQARNGWNPMDTLKCHTPQDYGNTIPDQSSSPWW